MTVRKGLTRESILKESFAIVDSGGAEALTMRRLAQNLGVATMAVYNHYRDRDDILDALADQMFAELPPPARKPTPKARLRTIIMAAHKAASDHPHVYRLAMTRPNKPASAFRVTIQSLEALREAGLSEAEAITAYHTFLLLLQGFPFWQDGFQHNQHDAPEPLARLCLKSSADQFADAVEWLLNSLDRLGKKRP